MLQALRRRGIRHGEELLWLAPVAIGVLTLFLLAQLFGPGESSSAVGNLSPAAIKALRGTPHLLNLLCLAILFHILLVGRRKSLSALLSGAASRLGSPLLLTAGLAPLILMPMLISAFGIFKMMMPLHAPFRWDEAFAAADRALFFGVQPWRITHAVFSTPSSTMVIELFYSGWVLLLSIAIVASALVAPRYDRARFFLSFTAAWLLLGILGAYLGSSAGPCYAALVGSASAPEYAELMDRLRGYAASGGPGAALGWQAILWEAHATRSYSFGMGISAMPSLHNAIAVLYAFALFRFGRLYGVAGSAFAAIIFIGSIHLGWHYAVDGIVAALAMTGIWWGAGRYLERSGYSAAVARAEPAAAEPPLVVSPAL